MNKPSTLALVVMGFVVTLIFWMNDLIPSIASGLAIIGVVVAFVVTQSIEEQKLTTLSKILAAWLILTVGLPAAWNLLTSRAPITKQAAEDRAVYEDLRGSETIRPQGLLALEGYRRMLDAIDDAESRSLADQCTRLANNYRHSKINDAVFQREVDQLASKIRNLRQFRGQAGKLLTEDYPQPTMTWVDRLQAIPFSKAIRIVGIGLGLALVVSALTGKKQIGRAAWAMAIVLLVLFAINRISQYQPSSGVAAASVAPADRRPTMTVAIRPDRWSDWVRLPQLAKTRCKFPGWREYEFSNGERIRVEESGEIIRTSPDGQRSRLIEFPRMYPSQAFRLQGKAGNAVITITG